MTKEKEVGSKITIDELARMMNHSFEHLENKLGNKIDEVKISLRAEMREGFAEVNKRKNCY